MKQLNHIKGVLGETRAEKYLKKHGFKILDKNVQNHCGEIDIVAKQNDTIVFVEVKMRFTDEFGLPREAVTSAKQNKIRSAATLYLQQKHLLDAEVRFDVIEILGKEISHLENCF